MMLSDIASIATAVSGLAVTASLIYVGIQTKQNVSHTRALIHQGTAARTTQFLLACMDAEIVAAWIEGNGGTSTPQLIRRRQFHYQCGAAMVAMEDYFGQHEDGLLGEAQFSRGCETFRELLREPGLRTYWLKHRATVEKASPRCCAFIDSLCTGDEKSPSDLI